MLYVEDVVQAIRYSTCILGEVSTETTQTHTHTEICARRTSGVAVIDIGEWFFNLKRSQRGLAY